MKNKELIAKMTLEEKASLMSGKNFWMTQDLPKYGIPSAFLADGPHGIRKQASAADHLGLNPSLKATCFPTGATMANSFNDVLGEEMGTALGIEAVAQRVNVLLGPGMNIKRNPRCGRNFEYFSEDPYLAGKMAASYIRGIQKSGVAACGKHFAANNQEERRMVIDSVIDERTYREIYLTNFEIAVKEGGLKTVMSAYNKVNGEFANENNHLLKEILRDDWGFKGVVVTDWGGDNDRVEGLKCGNELEMPTTCGDTNRDIIEAVKSGRIQESVLDECVDRLLTLVFETSKALKEGADIFDDKVHHKLAQKCAEECIVLLKNEGNVLPLDKSVKAAVIGDFAQNPRYQGAGSSVVNPSRLDSALSCMENSGLNYIGYEQGFNRYGKKKGGLIKKAVKLAKRADVVILYLGLDEVTEAEGLDREDINLPENQKALLAELKKTGKKIVVVLSCGSAIETGWTDMADAVVHAYLAGQAGANAVFNVLTGKVNPSGKLSESYPYKYEDTPSASNFPGHEETIEYREGPFIGYRYYDTAGVPVRFPFGFGLSYTTFEYSNISANEKGVSFTLKNTGKASGAEAAQLYVGMKDGQVFRPSKELKGFKKIFLNPGESKQVTILFDEYTFRYFNVKTNKWEVEGGTYNIMIGASSADIKLSAEVGIKGTGAECPYVASELQSYYSGKAANVSLEEFERLLGHKAPDPHFKFYKKKRMVIGYNSTVAQLRYSKRWVGRLFAGGIRFGIKFLRGIGRRTLSNVLIMGVYHQPMRGLSRMTGGAISWGQLNGMIMMFNGKFFKGLGVFMKQGKIKKKLHKAEKAAAAAEAAAKK